MSERLRPIDVKHLGCFGVISAWLVDEILVDPSPSAQLVVSQSQPSPSGWDADTGERSARDEYYELELTRHGNEAGFSGSLTEEVTTVGCDSPDIHVATKPGKYCIRCGSSRARSRAKKYGSTTKRSVVLPRSSAEWSPT